MKKLIYPTLSLFLCLLVFNQSCKKDNNSSGNTPTPSTGKPTLTLSWNSGAGYTDADGNASGGSMVSLKLVANPSSGEKLKSIKVTVSVNSAADIPVWDSTFNVSTFTKEVSGITVPSIAGTTSKFTATVTQSNNQTASDALTITATAANPGAPKATIEWDKGSGYSSTPGNVDAVFNFNVKFSGKSVSGQNLKSAIITSSFNSGPETVLGSTTSLSDSTYVKEMKNMQCNVSTGKITYKLVVAQADGKIDSTSLTITVNSKDYELAESPSVILGAQNNSIYGSYFNFSTQTVANLATANAAPEKIDFAYAYTTSGAATLSAPSDADITKTYPGVASWSTRQGSSFKKTTFSATSFDALPVGSGSVANVLNVEANSDTYSSKITSLKMGDVIMFISAGGKYYAMMKVVSTSVGGAGNIELDIKYADIK